MPGNLLGHKLPRYRIAIGNLYFAVRDEATPKSKGNNNPVVPLIATSKQYTKNPKMPTPLLPCHRILSGGVLRRYNHILQRLKITHFSHLDCMRISACACTSECLPTQRQHPVRLL